MSAKQIIGGVLFVAGVALIATGIGAPLGTIALGAGLGSISVASVIATGLLITSSMLLGPSVPKMPASLGNMGRERLQASLDVRAPRKILYGNTAGPSDMGFRAFPR